MNDCIYRQEAINAVRSYYDEFDKRKESIEERIEQIPAAPVQEVKRGRWVAFGNTGLASCECGYITDRYSIYSYCPKCGAHMEGGSHEQTD